MNTELAPKEATDALFTQGLSLKEKAQAITIVTAADRESAEVALSMLAAFEKEVKKDRQEPYDRAYADYQFHRARLNDPLDASKEARKLIKDKCMAWDDDQERIREAAENAAAAAARKAEEDARIAAAAEAEKSGDHELAEAIIEAPVHVPAPVLPRTGPKPTRLSAGREIWSAEVTDPKAVLQAVIDGNLPQDCVEINLPYFNALAVHNKALMNDPKSKLHIKGVVAKSRRV